MVMNAAQLIIFFNHKFFLNMERIVQNPVVKDVTTKKKYVKPDFEVINLEDTPKLLAASANSNASINALQQNNWFDN